MADNSSNSSSNGIQSAPPIELKIPMGGSLDRNAFSRAVGQNFDDSKYEEAENDLPEGEAGEAEDDTEHNLDGSDLETAKTEDPTEKDSEESDIEEISEESKDIPKGKGFQLRLANGKEFKIPSDAVIYHKVDGEYQEINIADAVTREVGELTVQQRLSKMSNLEHQYKTAIAQADNHIKGQQKFFQEIIELASSKKPEVAIAKIAELKGVPPGKIYKQIFETALEWASAFNEQGKTIEEMDSYWANIDNQWYQDQLKKKDSENLEKQSKGELSSLAAEAIKTEGLTEQEFSTAVSELIEENAFENQSNAKCIDLTCERALLRKHEGMVKKALTKNPTLLKDQKLINTLLRVTNPHDWTVDEILELAIEYKKDSVANSLNRKPTVSTNGASPRQNVMAKQKEKSAKIRTIADMRAHFGIR